MRSKKIKRAWIWLQSLIDGRRNLPFSDADALGETEAQIKRGANISIRKLEEKCLQEIEGLRAKGSAKQLSYEKAKAEFERLSKKTGRSRVQSPGWGYWLPMTILSASELAFNLWSFAVFEEPEWSTLLIGSGLGLAVPLGASFMGKWLRESAVDPGKRMRLWLTGTVLAGGLVTLNYFRLAHFRQTHAALLQANPAMSWAFLGVNFLVLVVAMWLKYEATDPEPGFAKAQKEMEELAGNLAAIRGKINALNHRLDAMVEQIREAGLQAILFYRMWNKRFRSNRPPRYFDDPRHPQHVPEIGVRLPQLVKQPRREAGQKDRGEEAILHAMHSQKLLK